MLQNQLSIEMGDTKIAAEFSIGKDANRCMQEIEDGVLVTHMGDKIAKLRDQMGERWRYVIQCHKYCEEECEGLVLMKTGLPNSSIEEICNNSMY